MNTEVQPFVGRPLPRVEAELKAAGAVAYTADIVVQNLLHAALVASPIARGRILSADTTAAEELTGVVRVLPLGACPVCPAVPSSPIGTSRTGPPSSPWRTR
jgi:xanthine dehydrogenase YagR molybdenum-binding subunit